MLWQAEEMILVWLSQALRLGGPHLRGDLDSFIFCILLVSNTWSTSALPKTMSSHPAFLSKQNSIIKKLLLHLTSPSTQLCCCTSRTHIFWVQVRLWFDYRHSSTLWFAKLNDLIQLDQPEHWTGDTNTQATQHIWQTQLAFLSALSFLHRNVSPLFWIWLIHGQISSHFGPRIAKGFGHWCPMELS